MREYFSQDGGVNIQVSGKDSSSRTLWWGKMRYWIFCITTGGGGVLQTWMVPHACNQIFVFKAYTKLDSLNDWRKDWESVRKTYSINFWVYCNYFFIEDQLSELETGEDVKLMFETCNMLEWDNDRRTLKEALQIIGRRDLSTQLEIYLEAGK